MNKNPGCFRINYEQKPNTTVYLFHIQKDYSYFSSWTTECGLNLQKKTDCRVQQGIMFALDLPLLHSSFVKAQIHQHTKKLFTKPSVPGLDSQSFIRQITPRKSLQSSEICNKIPFIITASFSLSSFLKTSSSCFLQKGSGKHDFSFDKWLHSQCYCS